jgi:diguanylate cyclase (GGDEF)-like protein/PAS domain S-box-containing protein
MDCVEKQEQAPSRRSGAEVMIAAHHDLYRFLVESLSEYAVFVISPTGQILTWNRGAEYSYGYTKDEVIGTSFGRVFTAEDVAASAPERELNEALSGTRLRFERWNLRKDGTRFWATTSMAPVRGADGELIGFTKFVADTTESYRAREALKDSEERLRLLIESIPEYAIYSLALDGSITTWNTAAHRALGYAEHEIIGKHFAQLFSPEDVANGVPDIVLQKALALGNVDEDRWFVRKDGTRFLGSEKISRIKRGSHNRSAGFVHIAQDITARHTRAEELRRQASLDQLTNLPNRGTFLEHVARAISAMKRHPQRLFAVMFIDLDRFKEVNDTFGHMAADMLLETTARRLEFCARAEDIVSRLGGDEFAVLLNGISDIGDANDAANRIAAEMRKPVVIEQHVIRATVSVGIALGSAQYARPEDIVRDADAAMYVAKGRSRAASTSFAAPVATADRSAFELQDDLRHAVDRNELRVFYQPVMRLADASIAGFEALVRWQHPRRGLLQPRDFIVQAEDHGLIIDVDHWVLREACKMLASWRRQFARLTLTMSVNFSGKEFSDPDLIDELRNVLSKSGIPSRCLNVEITESAIMERSDRTYGLLKSIRDLGVSLHIDDFGVGYSSFAALADMPVQALKIDRSFITKMQSRSGAELVRTIKQLAHNLGLEAIAEGIETEEQLDGLNAVKCEFGQGYLFSEPLEEAAASRLLGEKYLRGHCREDG